MLGRMPYLDEAVEALESGVGAADLAAWAPNAHWGLFEDGDEPADTESLIAATDSMNELICDCADVADGDAVLDVGCGFGGTLNHVNGRLRGSRLVGVNIDLRQLRLCLSPPQPTANTLDWVCADGCALPLGSGTFDAVLSVESAFHMASRATFFREVSRVLRSAGRFVVADFLVSLERGSGQDPAQRGARLAHVRDARQALDDFFGHSPAGLVSRGSYERHARGNGFRLDQDLDISAKVMPSFRSVSAVYDRSGLPGSSPTRSAAAIRRLQTLMHEGVVEYHVITFVRERPAS